MHNSTLLLGGNIGDTEALLNEAINHISKLGVITKKSKIYASEAWGFESDNNFLNIAIIIKTNFSAEDLLSKLQKIEAEMGRIRLGNGYASRTMDIDIIFYDNIIINSDKLEIPHPRLHERMFTLKCLMDILPDYNHPVLNKSITELTKSCTDNIKVWEN